MFPGAILMDEEVHDAARELVGLFNSLGIKEREKTLSTAISYIIAETKIPKLEKLVALTKIGATIETDVCEQLDLFLAMRKENEITEEGLNKKVEELTDKFYDKWVKDFKR